MKYVKVGDNKTPEIPMVEQTVNPELEKLVLDNQTAVKELLNNPLYKYVTDKIDKVEKDLIESTLRTDEMSSVQYYRGGVWILRELKKTVLEVIKL